MDAVFATLMDANKFGSDVPMADSVRPTTESGRPRSAPSVSRNHRSSQACVDARQDR